METKKESLSPPYVSPKTLFGFTDRFKQVLPPYIDRTTMNGYSGAVMSQLSVAMKYLGLIGNNGDTTDLMRSLVTSEGEERAVVVKGMLYEAYPFLRDGFDLGTATSGMLDQRFRDLGVSGDTLRKCASFLITVARDAGLPVSPHLKTSGGSSPSRGTTRKTTKRPTRIREDRVEEEEENLFTPPPPDPPQDKAPVWAQMLVDKLPDFDMEWPDDVKAKWFDAFKLLMEMQSK